MTTWWSLWKRRKRYRGPKREARYLYDARCMSRSSFCGHLRHCNLSTGWFPALGIAISGQPQRDKPPKLFSRSTSAYEIIDSLHYKNTLNRNLRLRYDQFKMHPPLHTMNALRKNPRLLKAIIYPLFLLTPVSQLAKTLLPLSKNATQRASCTKPQALATMRRDW